MKFRLSFFIATWGFSGCIRPFSGTWGTLFSLPFVYGLHWFLGQGALIIATIILVMIGFLAIEKLGLEDWEDPSNVVIDETVGIFLTFCFLPSGTLSLYVALGGFVLFRIFDGWKPLLIGSIEQHFSGTLGIMLDDIVAGLFAGLLLYLFLGL